MEWFWGWSGKCIGYRIEDALFTCEGKQLGQFAEGDEVYGSNGDYLGEVRNGDRLITNLSKVTWKRNVFAPGFSKISSERTDASAKQIPTGFQDFPFPSRPA
jgi:hypothetical protein